ncbi:MAG TPA: hypothetical protein VKF63_10135 [Terracidiphilus sp.]|nr:hypothetical protein [Terracidiphilus sp.]
MYTNGNFESHMAALCFLGTAGLTVLLAVATLALFFTRRAWARYSAVAIVVLLAGYGLLLGFFSWASYDRTVARGDEKFFCALDCHIAYSVQNVERRKAVGDATAQGEFVVVTVRSHFDGRTIAPWRGNGALTPDPPMLELVDGNGRSYPVSPVGQQSWEKVNANSHSLTDPLRPGESHETTWVFDVPADAQSVRMFAGWHGFPEYLLIGDESSPRHGKTYFAL